MIVIADDITGAAEIAGIAHSQGQTVRLVCAQGSVCCDCVATDGTTVIATDTRSMSEADAAAESRRIARHLTPQAHSEGLLLLFKKTDSALRGHVVAELTALLETTGYHRAVYLPANPSKGRIIRGGVYYIRQERDIPLHETAFSYDPEFPAHSSVLRERFPDAEEHGIIMPDAETLDDIRQVIDRYNDGHTLFAGAADLFRTYGERDWQHGATEERRSDSMPANTLILCGSTQSKPLDLGIPVCPMPREVYDGEQGAADWFAQLPTALHAQKGEGSLILTIPYTHRTGKATAVHLRTVMAEMARLIINNQLLPSLNKEKTEKSLHLIIEGGATAWATLQALGWTTFRIERQIAPGVVQMRTPDGILVTLKPGSYPWGDLF